MSLMETISNAVETKIRNNYVEFTFKNIHLPIGGHGNVLFKIKTQPDLSVGDEVMNMANIYFDYNAPIDTQEARSLFSNLSNDDFLIREKISVVPNPARNLVKVTAEIDINSVQIFDAMGRLLQTVVESSKALTIDISDKTNGVYFLKINTDRGSGIQKIIKE